MWKFAYWRLVWSKAYKVLDEKVQKSYASWHWRVMQSLKKSWLLVPKMTWRIWWILMREVASQKSCNLMCYFCRKYSMFVPKKYRGVMYHKTQEWCQIWGGTDLCFKKWHEGSGEFWLNTRNSQNLHFNGLLLSKLYNILAKKLQMSYVSWHWRVMQYLKKLTSGLKNDIRNRTLNM